MNRMKDYQMWVLIDLKKLILKFHIFQLTHCVIVEVILNLLQNLKELIPKFYIVCLS